MSWCHLIYIIARGFTSLGSMMLNYKYFWPSCVLTTRKQIALVIKIIFYGSGFYKSSSYHPLSGQTVYSRSLAALS